MRVVGIEHKQGVYEGRPYDKYNIHCLENESGDLLAGETCHTIKLKAVKLSEAFGFLVTESDLVSLLGSEINPLYDRYKNPIRIEFVMVDGKKASQAILDHCNSSVVI